MAFCFNVDEILTMAEQIERNGAAFYRAAAEIATDEAVRAKLVELAEMEDGHVTLFAEMRSELAAEETATSTYDPEGEVGHYLEAMADASVFDRSTGPTDLVVGKSTAEILRLALGFEKDSILFYLGLKASLCGAANRERIDRILQEEMSHVALLRGQLMALS